MVTAIAHAAAQLAAQVTHLLAATIVIPNIIQPPM